MRPASGENMATQRRVAMPPGRGGLERGER